MTTFTPSPDLGPLADRVAEALRGSSAYHVPQPPNIRAKLDANELPFGFPAELRTRLGAALAEVALERYPDPRARELRAVVAAQLGVAGDQLTFGKMAPTSSSRCRTSAFAAEPAGVLYPTPSFVYYRLSAIARGLPVVEVPLGARFELDEAAIERAIIAQRPSLVFLALPNNPTGTLWRVGFARELAARHPDVVVVSDEAYLAYCGETNLPAAHGNLVVMRTLSKIGMAGLRVGFTISSPAIAAVLEKVRPPYNVSSLDQRAAVFLLCATPWGGAPARASPTSSPNAASSAVPASSRCSPASTSFAERGESALAARRASRAPQLLWQRARRSPGSSCARSARAVRSPVACAITGVGTAPPRTRCSFPRCARHREP